ARMSARRSASGPANRNARATDRAGSALLPSSRRDRYSAGEFGSVFEKSLGQRVGSLREQDAGSRAERGLLSPPGKRVGRATAGGIKARGGVAALEFAHDQLAIAIDVRADLQHRRSTVASGQRRQVGFWHNHGDLHRSPGQGLETKTNPNFLRIGRDLVVMQDDISHRASPRLG